MTKKLLVLVGSPRKEGNSDLLCDEFIKGAKEEGNETKKIYIQDYNLNYCLGCYTCTKTGKCVHDDNIDEIIDAMVEADVIVLSTPVYFYAISGQMKTFIDRCVGRYTEIKNKEFYFIATAAVQNKFALERAFDGFRGYLDCLTGSLEKYSIYGVGAWEAGDILGSPAMNEAYEIGKSI